jgi:hypothetical protein
METNVKMVGFANQSINGVTLANEGFDMEYDGTKLNISGFSGDKLYYAKLNNKQLVDLLNIPSSDIPLERRIMLYKNPKMKSIKQIKLTPRKSIKRRKSSAIRVSKRKSSSSKYVSPAMRSEYKKSRSKRSSKHSSKSKRRSINKTIY